MAEFVQQSIEEMLPELEQMERVGLFTNSETKAMLKKRNHFEYKLRRKSKLKEDFLQYIQYEMHVLALTKKRREKEGYRFKFNEIEVAILKRIHKLFNMAISRFQEDADLWLSYIDFCKKRNEKANVTKMYSKMLQVHNRDPSLWISAAKFEIEIESSMETARSLLQRGLRFNNNSQQLWLEYFRMELLNSEKHRKRQEILGVDGIDDKGSSKAVMDGMVALLVYNKATETIPDNITFSLSFLPVTRLFSFATHIENHIFTKLEKENPNDELLWEAKARKKLDMLPTVISDPQMNNKEKVKKISEAETEFCEVFDSGLQVTDTEKMWSLYIENLLKLLEESVPSKIITKRVHKTLEVFNHGHASGHLAEALYQKWITVLLKVGLVGKAWEVSLISIEKYPKSVQAWKQHLDLLICKTTEDKQPVFTAIKQAISSVSHKKSEDLWKFITDWYILEAPDQIEEILETGLASKSSKICRLVKEQYLQWAVFHQPIKEVRNLYKKLTEIQPVSLKFYQQYINIEKSQLEVKMKYIRKGYDDALENFGTSNPDLWLDFIKLEMYHPKGNVENVGNIHWRAMRQLEGSFNEEFVTQYTLLQSGHKT